VQVSRWPTPASCSSCFSPHAHVCSSMHPRRVGDAGSSVVAGVFVDSGIGSPNSRCSIITHMRINHLKYHVLTVNVLKRQAASQKHPVLGRIIRAGKHLQKRKKFWFGDDRAYLAGMISERSPAGINSRIAPFANSRRGSEKSNLSDGSAKVIFMSGDRVQASPAP